MSLSDEEILEMAQDAFMCRIVPLPVKTNRIIDFARRIAAKQREKDAQIAESHSKAEYATGKVDHNERAWSDAIAAVIRSQA